MRLQPVLNRGSSAKGTTNSLRFHYSFEGRELLSPVDAQDPIDTFLLSIGLAGLSDQNDFTILFREPGCDDTVSSQQAANRAPRSFVAVLFEAFTNPTQQMTISSRSVIFTHRVFNDPHCAFLPSPGLRRPPQGLRSYGPERPPAL